MTLLRGLILTITISFACYSAWRIPAPRGAFFQRLALLITLAAGVEFIGTTTNAIHIRNTWMYNLYAMVEFVVMLDLVRVMRPKWRQPLVAAVCIGIVVMVWSMWRRGPNNYLAIEGLLAICLICSAVFLWLLVDLARDSTERLACLPAFWLFTGALLYFGGIIPILGAWKLLGQLDRGVSRSLYSIVVGIAIVRYLFAARACRLERERRRT